MSTSYSLRTPLNQVAGVGPILAEQFAAAEFQTVSDLLGLLPLRYEDRSLRKTIDQLEPGEMVTVQGIVTSMASVRRGARIMYTANVKDETGSMRCLWFNAPYVLRTLRKGEPFLFSGKMGERKTMMQPIIERAAADPIHTDRVVPLYTTTLGIKVGSLRRLLKHVLDHLEVIADPLTARPSLNEVFSELHFPASLETVEPARQRLALEELLHLIQYSHQLKETWRDHKASLQIPADHATQPQISFELTPAQLRCIQEVTADLAQPHAMNRLLIGDVGAGKTLVAGSAMAQVIAAGHSAVFACPTRILAEQHTQTLQQAFPEMPIQILTADSRLATWTPAAKPTAYIGTHAVLNKLKDIQPAFIVYDEQHRFGVRQRSLPEELPFTPHVLTLTATPIPRTLTLTIFSHLNISVIDQLPPNRLPTKTWLVPKTKREKAWAWLVETLGDKGQLLVICPFINDSETEGFEHIASTESVYKLLKKVLPKKLFAQTAQLHSQLPKDQQRQIIEKMRSNKIQVLVTTPIVEVGVDLPAAQAVVILNPERFGLASLHQLRGRVGRAGQQGYCLLFPEMSGQKVKERLQVFSEEHNGLKLAEYDLEHRGAGDVFGLEQHGLNTLKFGSWSDAELIHEAQSIIQELEKQDKKYHSPLEKMFEFGNKEAEAVARN